MKTFINIAILLTTISLLAVSSVSGQSCSKKKFCSEEEYGNFDYRSQSSYAILSPGDTARASIVIYSKQDARILVCFDPALGSVNWRIYEPLRYTKRSVKAINRTEEEFPVYAKDKYGDPIIELDENGEQRFDENYEPVYKIERYEKSIQIDTVWQTEKINTEEVIFDNIKDGKTYWQRKSIPATKRLIIEVIVPENENGLEGCVNVEVGHKTSSNKKSFQKLDD